MLGCVPESRRWPSARKVLLLIICPTADYEVYLGRNLLPAEEVLFTPTRKLLAVWEEFGIRATLFADICSAWRHRELDLPEFAARFEAQLQGAAAAGHDVQLHLHPEWLQAQHSGSAWRFTPHTGALHDLGFDPQDPQGAPALIRRGRRYLEDLLAPVRPDYRCMAFRAGGWILQPEAPVIAALRDAGIQVDATVIPGARLLRTDYRIDYRTAPNRTHWHVDPQQGLGVDSERSDDLLEISIAAYRGPWIMLHHALSQIRLRRRARRAPEPLRGSPMVTATHRAGPLQRLQLKYRKLNIPRALDVADSHEAMLATLRWYLSHFDCESRDQIVCMNGHPKDTYDYHLEEARRFFGEVGTRYRDRVRFESIATCFAQHFAH
jgi:hypothetical protein